MNKQRLLLAALIFSISGWVSASVPIIKLQESRSVEVNFYSLLALNSSFFGIRDTIKPAVTSADHGMPAAPVSGAGFGGASGLRKHPENASILTGKQVSAGSFSSYASDAFTSSSAIAPISDTGLHSAERRYGLMVGLPSAPKIWVVLLLALGCVIYQGRRRQRPFGFEKNRLPAASVVA